MHYTGTIWRPPYEASSLLLEVTAGEKERFLEMQTFIKNLQIRTHGYF